MTPPTSIFGTPLSVDRGIVLEPVMPGDAQELFALVDANRAYLRQWLPWVNATGSIKDTRLFIEISRAALKRKSGASLCIRHRGRIAGVIGFHVFNWPNRSTSMGYWLDENLQGRGIMSKSCRKLVDCCFSDLGLNRVEIRCAVANVRSRAIPERLGFVKEGTFRDAEWLNDRFVDLVVYGMLAGNWPSAPGGRRRGPRTSHHGSHSRKN